MKKSFSEIIGTIVSNFKKEKSSRNQLTEVELPDYCKVSLIAREIIFMLGWPIITAVACLFVHQLLSFNFWTEIVTLFTITGLIIYFVNKDGFKRDGFKRDRDGGITLRNILIILAGGSFMVFLSNTYNIELNNLSLTIKIVGACLLVASGIVVVLDISNMSNYYNQRLGCDTYYPGFTVLISLMIVILITAEIWMHFGSQFIWVPVIVSTACFFFANLRAREMSTKTKKIGFNLAVMLLFPALGIVSTMYQFWFSRIVWEMKLWHIVSVLGGIVLILTTYYFISYLKNKKKTRLELEDVMAREKYEKQKETLERKEKFDALLEKEFLTIEDVIFAYEYNSSKIYKLEKLYEKISLINLKDGLKISEKKKKITWEGNFSYFLKIIDEVAGHVFDDKLLEKYEKQLSGFKDDMYKNYSEYNDQSTLIGILGDKCPIITELLEK